MRDVGMRVVDRLIEHGITHVFGVPGGQSAPLYHGLAVKRADIEHVLMRDERSAVFAADAYARIRGVVGVCDATVGPGATNLVSGLVEAHCSSIPILAVIADIPRSWGHRRHLGSASQGYEQRDILASCVKWYGRVEVPEQVDDVLDHAMRVATSNRPGPVIVEIPTDVFAAPFHGPFRELTTSGAFPRMRTAPDPAAISAAVKLVKASRRPAMLVGGGAHIASAYDEVRVLAERLGTPVATTLSGKGAISERHVLAIGVCGSFGSPVANATLAAADCVILVGCKGGQGATLDWTFPAADAKVVHMDVDADEIGRNFGNTLPVQCDAKLGLRALDERLDAQSRSHEVAWDYDQLARRVDEVWAHDAYKTPTDMDRIKPQVVIKALARYLAPEDVVVTDASLSSGWAGSRWRTERAGRRVLAPRGVAGLGWGLPGATGAAFAVKDDESGSRVVCLAGDGGWAYSLAEIETLARFSIPLVSVVLNNGCLAWNKHVAMRRYPDAWVSQDFGDADWSTAARALGAWAIRVNATEQLDDALAEAFGQTKRPAVVEVMSSEHETPVVRAGDADAVNVTAY